MGKILEKINKPNDVRRINKKYYKKLAEEIREFLLEHVSQTGGHLASNLGAVELTIALHAVLKFPRDQIVWDVGHQAYTHKLLTGRRKDFDNMRKLDGMSGFPKRHESDCDSFDTGHSSTSISAALGMATARKLSGGHEKIVAVIGDGALTGGMALEALNNVSQLHKNFVIILNDNNMSISENVGGMSNYLNKLRVGERYNEFKEDVEHSLSKIPHVGNSLVKKVKNTKDYVKGIFVDSNWFDDLGITYIGPVDGHNMKEMVKIFEAAFKIDHPILIHVKTIKGKGYEPAEENPSLYHGVGCFDLNFGAQPSSDKVLSYTDVFSKTLVKMAAKDKKIVAITAAMPDGTGLTRFQNKYPDRFFDVGIAEEHAVTFAAGLASKGYKPYVSIYSSFYQRAYDQILHDVCIQNLPVRLIIDRAGLVGQDGETHQGVFDISFLSAMPNMTIIAPKDMNDLIKAMHFADSVDGPLAIRFGRGTAYVADSCEDYEYGKSELIESGKKAAIIAVGGMVEEAAKAMELFKEEQLTPTFVNARFLAPMDREMIRTLAAEHDYILVVEEGMKQGGYGQTVQAFIEEEKLNAYTEVLAIDNQFVEHGTVPELRKRLGIDAQSIYEKVKERML
ncbi:MAG: 1-deoxy-D-xylulose-5-phosphate synthase [Eubacterium sp.]|nr:1-deoxy-D-xylulose-5-phosphate synthase [Eubacterium sp.]